MYIKNYQVEIAQKYKHCNTIGSIQIIELSWSEAVKFFDTRSSCQVLDFFVKPFHFKGVWKTPSSPFGFFGGFSTTRAVKKQVKPILSIALKASITPSLDMFGLRQSSSMWVTGLFSSLKKRWEQFPTLIYFFLIDISKPFPVYIYNHLGSPISPPIKQFMETHIFFRNCLNSDTGLNSSSSELSRIKLEVL